jgi:uncharacterized protein DUF4349
MPSRLPARTYVTASRAIVVAAAGATILLLMLIHARARVGASGERFFGQPVEATSRDELQLKAAPPAVPARSQAEALDATPRDAPANALAAPGALALAWSEGRSPIVAESAPMVIRTGTASIEVSSVDSTIPRIRLLAAQVGGYVANSSIQGGHEQVRTATIEIKAPAQNYDRLVAALAPIGTVESVNVTAEDVGEEYVDVDARLANDRRLDERLVQLLGTRTGKLKDVLDVERELARVREEMERYEGRLRFLKAHAAVSSLSITIHQPVPIIDHPGPNPLIAAARQAWQNFVALVALGVASLGVVVPIGGAAAVAWWLLRRRQRAVASAQQSAVGS